MKFNEDQETGLYLLKSYGDGWIQINNKKLESGFILGPSILIEDSLPRKFSGLKNEHLERLFSQEIEVALIGTGRTLCLPTPEIHQALVKRNTRFEFMTTAAACRTYRILNAEGRSVLALLFPA